MLFLPCVEGQRSTRGKEKSDRSCSYLSSEEGKTGGGRKRREKRMVARAKKKKKDSKRLTIPTTQRDIEL
jgi:hypothetical protein